MAKKKNRAFWTLTFIGVTLLLSALATSWNVVLIREYQSILLLARNFALPRELNPPASPLILKMVLGTLGFLLVLALSILIFIKLLREMRLNQLQSEFINTVSHELKTPLAAIELSATLIQSGSLPPTKITQLWKSHQDELKRLQKQVETLLEAARWQSKPFLFQKDPLYLEEWLQNSYARWELLLGPEGELRRTGESLPILLNTHLQAFDLILDNLFSNAKKFARGHPQVTLHTTLLKKRLFSRTKWRLAIEDKGWGFDPKDSKKIFHRFFRSHHFAPYAISGTGLGLYLAYTASRALGMKLTAQSQGEGQGATFTIEGPLP